MTRAFLSPRPWLLLAAALALTLSPQAQSLPAQAQSTTAGSLDLSFGGDGKVTASLISSESKINAMAVQSDGKILAAGGALSGSGYDFVLARYTADGVLDTTFGTGGKVTTSISPSHDTLSAIAVQSDGKILVAGGATLGATTISRWRVTPPTGPWTPHSAATRTATTLRTAMSPPPSAPALTTPLRRR